jgi:hypothetical protein
LPSINATPLLPSINAHCLAEPTTPELIAAYECGGELEEDWIRFCIGLLLLGEAEEAAIQVNWVRLTDWR